MFSNDDDTLRAAIEVAVFLGAPSAREAAKLTLHRQISDQEWTENGERWEKAWLEIDQRLM